MLRRLILAVFAAWAAGAVLPARAAEPAPPPGWEPAEMVYLLGTAHYDARLENADGFLAARGDFDGDGGQDLARLFVHRGDGHAALFVTLAGDTQPWAHRLATVTLAEVVALGVATRPHGDFRTTCNMGVSDERACGDVSEIGDHDNLTLFTFRAAARVFWWSGDGFVSAWMHE